eukprot:2037529-Rhodomonas_salina.1
MVGPFACDSAQRGRKRPGSTATTSCRRTTLLQTGPRVPLVGFLGRNPLSGPPRHHLHRHLRRAHQ